MFTQSLHKDGEEKRGYTRSHLGCLVGGKGKGERGEVIRNYLETYSMGEMR